MLRTQDILQFHFSQTTLKQSAQNIIPVALITLIEHRIDKLQNITQGVGANTFIFSGNNLIPYVFKKFKSSLSNVNTKFERRELRTLTYALSHSEQNMQTIFSNNNELTYALKLFDSSWKDSLLVGLIDCFLKNWDTKHRNSLEQLEQFIAHKLEIYSGNRNTLMSFKSNKRFFNTKNGDLILGDVLAKLDRPIGEATNLMGVPESWIAYPYFSKVIVTYYERNKNKIENEIENLNDVLLKHNSTVTNKRLVSKIIIQANQPQFATLQSKTKEIAFTLIGDPSNISNWAAFDGATETEKGEIIEARNILDEWIAKQFIDIFFRVCLNDERRKRFWLKVASKNRLSFKIYGSDRTKQRLQQEEKIKEYLDARFEVVDNKKDISAFILFIGDFMLIEFSDAGYAFYAYKVHGKSKPVLNYRLNSVDELRNSSMPMLVYRTGYNINSTNSEGRLGHNDGDLRWEQVFEYWFKNIAGINV